MNTTTIIITEKNAAGQTWREVIVERITHEGRIKQTTVRHVDYNTARGDALMDRPQPMHPDLAQKYIKRAEACGLEIVPANPLACLNVYHNEADCPSAHIPSESWCANCVEQDKIDADEYDEPEEDPDLLYERYLENGGPHADRIQAEDAIEREAEANDIGLQELREGR